MVPIFAGRNQCEVERRCLLLQVIRSSEPESDTAEPCLRGDCLPTLWEHLGACRTLKSDRPLFFPPSSSYV